MRDHAEAIAFIEQVWELTFALEKKVRLAMRLLARSTRSDLCPDSYAAIARSWGGHEAALGGVQIKPAAADGLVPHRVLLDQVDEVFEFAGLPVEAADVPDDDVRHPGPHLRDQRVVSVPPGHHRTRRRRCR
ncbi:hypothetical protein QE367_000382 [Microbacterium paludicola]|uniref:DUF222 domain-containing protein n=1 Tax=Microbacterium paludicola TaxID=300019 RepID=A0ABU1HZA9_9MICO|nr:hypothetical protein [Microbacterium paludicola]MDR6166178.1 hypothetical protein [Microbacterium paludicola]